MLTLLIGVAALFTNVATPFFKCSLCFSNVAAYYIPTEFHIVI